MSVSPLGKQLAFRFEPLASLADLLLDEPEAENQPGEERDYEHELGAMLNVHGIWVSALALPF